MLAFYSLQPRAFSLFPLQHSYALRRSAGGFGVLPPNGVNGLLDRYDFLCPVCVGAGESEPAVQVTALRVDQGERDAVGRLLVIAGDDAMIWTLERGLFSRFNRFDKSVADRSPRESHGAFDDRKVLFTGVNIALLEGHRGVAFVRRYKAGGHLNA